MVSKFLSSTPLNSPSISESIRFKLDHMFEIVNHPKFNKDWPTVVYVHGFMERGEDELSVMAVRGAYHHRNDHNIIIIDWSFYAQVNFPAVYKTPIRYLKEV